MKKNYPKKKFLKLLSRATNASLDPAFKKELEQKLLKKAPGFLRPRKPFSLLFNFFSMRKWSFMSALLLFMLIVGGLIMKPFINELSDESSHDLIIDRAFAAYEKQLIQQDQNGIFYQKALYEVDGDNLSIPSKKFIDETWQDEEGNSLVIQKNPQTGKILTARLVKVKDEKSPYLYEDIDNFLLIERLIKASKDQHVNIGQLVEASKEQHIKPDSYSKDGLDPRFIIDEYKHVFIPKIVEDPKLARLMKRFMEHGFLRIENIVDHPEKVEFDFVIKYLNNGCAWKEDCPTADFSKKLLTVVLTKSDGSIKAFNADGKELSPNESKNSEDYEKIYAQMNRDLDASPVGESIRKSWKLLDENYYCVDVSNTNDKNIKVQLQIAKDDSTAYSVSAAYWSQKDLDSRIKSPENAVEDLEQNLSEIERLRLTPESLKKLFENLKKEQNVEYKEEKNADGLRYYSFTIKESAGLPVKTFHFNAETYRLAKQIVNIEDDIGSRAITITYLDQKYLPQKGNEKLFDVSEYPYLMDSKTLTGDLGLDADLPHLDQTGCYEYNGARLSPEKEKALWDSVPAEAVQNFKQMKENIREETNLMVNESDTFTFVLT